MLNTGDPSEVGATPAARPTLKAVAAVANVSKTTVSRVINGDAKVSDRARRSVEDAIAQLGFVPNYAARSLATRRSGSYALVAPTWRLRALNDLFFLSVASVAVEELAAADAQLVLVPLQAKADQLRLVRYARGGHVDGIIVLSERASDPLPETLHSGGVPVVLGGRPLSPVPGVPYVDVNNIAGARSAVEHLVGQGRQTIATVAGPQDMCAGIDRLVGYRQAMESAGLPHSRFIAYADNFDEPGAERAMAELLDRVPELDAVYVACDTMAVAALRVLQQAGRRVPDDVAVVGNDDLGVAAHTAPPLTTVRQPVDEMAKALVRVLLARTRGESVPDKTVLPTTLAVRASA